MADSQSSHTLSHQHQAQIQVLEQEKQKGEN